MLTNENIKDLGVLSVTLTVAHALKLQLQGNLTLDGFTKSWLVASGGLLAGAVVNELVTSKIVDYLKNTEKYTVANMVLIENVLNTLVQLTVQQAVVSGIAGKVEFSDEWFRGVFLVISGILLYTILVKPLLPNNLLGIKKGTLNDMLIKISAIAASDYMSDLDFDNFPVVAGTTAAGILVGDLSSTPIGDAVNIISKHYIG